MTMNKDNELFALASKLLRRRRLSNAGFPVPRDQADETERCRLRAEYLKRVSEVEESTIGEHPPIAILMQRDH
jgi:hypothetical protein